MRILVTGATGRVGSRLVPRLLKKYGTARVLVRTEEQAESFRKPGAEAVVGDLRQPETLTSAVAGVDAIVHLAAFFRGAAEAEALATNLDGTLALAQAARQSGAARFVYISTNLVYGPGRGRPVREDDEPRPSSAHFYPASKLAAEQALTRFYASQPEGLCILRLAFVYGDGDPHLSEAMSLTRSWPPAKRMHAVHHADVAQAILLSLDEAEAGGQIFNVADDTPLPVSEIRQMQGWSGSGDTTGAEVEDPWEGIVDTTRIKKELGFRPIYPSILIAEKANAL